MEAVTSSDDHSYMESAKLYCADSDCLYSGRCHIRGRGNTTWRTFPKNPYNVEFDEDVSLLGMRAQAKWSLLANIYDGSEMKNAMALDIARAMNIPAWVEYRYANLYLNGEYAGLYLVTQHVDVSGGNIPIHDLGEENRIINDYDQPPEWDVYYDPGARSIEWFEGDSPSDISGGYLVEFVQYGAPGSGFFTTYHTMGVIESPKYHTYDESVYMLDYLLKIEDLIYNDPSEAYAEYIDLDSWSAMYLLKEFLADEDTDLYSLYAYKDRQSDAFVCGPAWDFDATMGVDRDGKHYESARMRWLKQRAESRRENGADEGWLNELYEGHTGFRQATRSLYVNSFRSILELELNDRLPMIHDLIADSAYMDHIRYPHRMRPVYDEGFDDEYSYMISWLEERLKYYDEYYEKDQ
ncbi:MAG: CotH kinase family protein [Lachnospiraceae bacterium]|nr:CotH kinase family protein [Lachnospiraceae bacterium]